MAFSLTVAGVATYAWYSANATITATSSSTTISAAGGLTVENYQIYKYDRINGQGKLVDSDTEEGETFAFNLPKYDYLIKGAADANDNVILRAEVYFNGASINTAECSLNIDVEANTATETETKVSNIAKFKSVISAYKTTKDAVSWTTATYPNSSGITEGQSAANIYSAATTYFNAKKTATAITFRDTSAGTTKRSRNNKAVLSAVLPKDGTQTTNAEQGINIYRAVVYVEASYDEDLIATFSYNASTPQTFSGDLKQLVFSLSYNKNGADSTGKYTKVTNSTIYQNSSDYLIVNEENKTVFNGNAIGSAIDAGGNFIGGASDSGSTYANYQTIINDDKSISSDDGMDKATVDVGGTTSDSTIKQNNGSKHYIYGPSGDTTGIGHNTTKSQTTTRSIADTGVATFTSNSKVLQYNKTSSKFTFMSGSSNLNLYRYSKNSSANNRLEGYSITSYPTKQDPYKFSDQETLDLSGLVITATYTAGNSINITNYVDLVATEKDGNSISEFSVSNGGSLSGLDGVYKIEVRYIEDGLTRADILSLLGGSYPFFNINVTSGNPVRGIAISGINTSYLTGDIINKTSLIVTVSYAAGDPSVITSASASFSDVTWKVKIGSAAYTNVTISGSTFYEFANDSDTTYKFKAEYAGLTSNEISVTSYAIILDFYKSGGSTSDTSANVQKNQSVTMAYRANYNISISKVESVSNIFTSYPNSISITKKTETSGTFTLTAGAGSAANVYVDITATVSNGNKSKSKTFRINIIDDQLQGMFEEFVAGNEDTTSSDRTFIGTVTGFTDDGNFWVQDGEYGIYVDNSTSNLSVTQGYKYRFTAQTVTYTNSFKTMDASGTITKVDLGVGDSLKTTINSFSDIEDLAGTYLLCDINSMYKVEDWDFADYTTYFCGYMFFDNDENSDHVWLSQPPSQIDDDIEYNFLNTLTNGSKYTLKDVIVFGENIYFTTDTDIVHDYQVSDTEVDMSIEDYIWDEVISSNTSRSSIALNDIVTASVSGGAYTGAINYNAVDWRLYFNENASITISVETGYQITAITLTYKINSGSGSFSPAITSGVENSGINAQSKTYTLSYNSSGNVGITRINVKYARTS